MSNYNQSPEVTDSCMICMEEYKTKQNIHIPKTCSHPICKKCYKRCTDCPYCKTSYKKKQPSDTDKRIKHILYLRRVLFRFIKEGKKNQEDWGNQYRMQYELLYNTHVHSIVTAEKELQEKMTAPQRLQRRKATYRLPYPNEDVNDLLFQLELLVPPVHP